MITVLFNKKENNMKRLKKLAHKIWNAFKPALLAFSFSFLVGYSGFLGVLAAAKANNVTLAIAMDEGK